MIRHWVVLGVVCVGSQAAELGLASWYGAPFDGRMAASGEIYRQEELTAAHRILPFGTRVLVRRMDMDRSVVVRINDRGPFVDSRIIDLSHAAAAELGMVEPGVVPVSLEIVGSEAASTSAGEFAVQAGAFRVLGNAQRMRASMEREYGKATIVRRERDGNDLWCVLIGEGGTQAEAAALAAGLKNNLKMRAVFVVRLGGDGAPGLARLTPPSGAGGGLGNPPRVLRPAPQGDDYFLWR